MALALPAFESLNVGFAATAPKAAPRRLLCIGNHLGFWPEGFFPTTNGREFTLSKTLAPLQAYRQDFTVFSQGHRKIPYLLGVFAPWLRNFRSGSHRAQAFREQRERENRTRGLLGLRVLR
jgi:hypothetical protein